MTLNPYAPPTAVVDDLAPSQTGIEPPFFAVSVPKLLIMSACTFSGYEIYWFYRQWKRIADREQEAMSPAGRAFFAVFYCYQCFGRIRDFDAEAADGRTIPAGALAIAWIVTTVLWRLPDPYWWISMAAPVFLVPVQQHVNRLNRAANPLHDPNSRFSKWNWMAVVFGGLLVSLALLGTFLPEVE